MRYYGTFAVLKALYYKNMRTLTSNFAPSLLHRLHLEEFLEILYLYFFIFKFQTRCEGYGNECHGEDDDQCLGCHSCVGWSCNNKKQMLAFRNVKSWNTIRSNGTLLLSFQYWHIPSIVVNWRNRTPKWSTTTNVFAPQRLWDVTMPCTMLYGTDPQNQISHLLTYVLGTDKKHWRVSN